MRTVPDVLHKHAKLLNRIFVALLFVFVTDALLCLAFAFRGEPMQFFWALCVLVLLCVGIRSLEPHVNIDDDPLPKLRDTGGL